MKLNEMFLSSYNIAKANFKLRNEGSYLGIIWYLLEPLLLFITIILVRENIGIVGIDNYPLYLLIGLTMFNFFRNATTSSANSIRNNKSIILSIKVRKEIFVFSSVTQFLFSHLFEIALLCAFMLIYSIPVYRIFFYALVLIFFILFINGISFVLSTIGSFVSDINNIWNVFTRILWFATPIFYMLHEKTAIYFFNIFNPLSYFINITRNFMISASLPSLGDFGLIVSISVLSFYLGLKFFQRYENRFAEVL